MLIYWEIYLVKLSPVKRKIIDLYFELGYPGPVSFGDRLQSVFILDNKTTLHILMKTSFDIGYLGSIGLGI